MTELKVLLKAIVLPLWRAMVSLWNRKAVSRESPDISVCQDPWETQWKKCTTLLQSPLPLEWRGLWLQCLSISFFCSWLRILLLHAIAQKSFQCVNWRSYLPQSHPKQVGVHRPMGSPSGLLPLLQDRPIGSLHAGTLVYCTAHDCSIRLQDNWLY